MLTAFEGHEPLQLKEYRDWDVSGANKKQEPETRANSDLRKRSNEVCRLGCSWAQCLVTQVGSRRSALSVLAASSANTTALLLRLWVNFQLILGNSICAPQTCISIPRTRSRQPNLELTTSQGRGLFGSASSTAPRSSPKPACPPPSIPHLSRAQVLVLHCRRLA